MVRGENLSTQRKIFRAEYGIDKLIANMNQENTALVKGESSIHWTNSTSYVTSTKS